MDTPQRKGLGHKPGKSGSDEQDANHPTAMHAVAVGAEAA